LLLLLSLGWVGHAVEGQGATKLVHEINQMLHLLAAGLWLGGLLPLAWLLGLARSNRARLGFRSRVTWCRASRRWDMPQSGSLP